MKILLAPMSSTLGDRLQEALTARGMSRRKFIARLSAAGAPGSSEPSVYRYLRNESEPSLAFIRAAAAELGASPAWLAFGDGPVGVHPEGFETNEAK